MNARRNSSSEKCITRFFLLKWNTAHVSRFYTIHYFQWIAIHRYKYQTTQIIFLFRLNRCWRGDHEGLFKPALPTCIPFALLYWWMRQLWTSACMRYVIKKKTLCAVCGFCVHEREVSGQSFTRETSWPNNRLLEEWAFSSIKVSLAVMWVLVPAQCVNTCWSMFQGYMLFLDLLIGLNTYILAFWRGGFTISLTYNFWTFASAKDVSGLSVVGLICLGVIKLTVENSQVNLTKSQFVI